MKKVSMSITLFPDVYSAMIKSIGAKEHESENELIDRALRKFLDIDGSANPDADAVEVPDDTGTSNENNKEE